MLGRRTGRLADGRTDVTPSAARGPENGLMSRLLAALRQLAGMPDYTGYLEHLRRHHPGTPAPSERQFYEDYLKGRYGDGPTRCC